MKSIDSEFKKLVAEIQNCTICLEYLPHGARPVLQANPEAKILIAGQAPGRRVHETGIPFDDSSGERLRTWMGIDSDAFYNASKIAILPMGFCYPGTGNSGDLPPRPECSNHWREKLLSHLPNVQLTLLLGKHGQKYHLGDRRKKNLTETVQNWKEYKTDGLFPLPHPSPRNNIWINRNPWFGKEVLPELKSRVQNILKD